MRDETGWDARSWGGVRRRQRRKQGETMPFFGERNSAEQDNEASGGEIRMVIE
jgi:hypothetical protein